MLKYTHVQRASKRHQLDREAQQQLVTCCNHIRRIRSAGSRCLQRTKVYVVRVLVEDSSTRFSCKRIKLSLENSLLIESQWIPRHDNERADQISTMFIQGRLAAQFYHIQMLFRTPYLLPFGFTL